MLLGKRPRPPMKRTTSMSEMTLDLNTAAAADAAANQQRSGVGPGAAADQTTRMLATPKILRRHSSDFGDTPPFLRACSLCKRCLVPGHDIYMYRGDNAFCSLECRQQQMNQDERKEKFVMASKKKVVATPPSGSQVAVATATKGETTVVAL
ncbi:hypothetical protein AAZX31_14G158300 [Glycine max]|uniref:FLZ-type domain-containing protein n=2 Tax=Glycine subgen. Soja TaxID=1462606 RepID=K7M7J8_SOYBN|nr:FCS-like zinc-finger domain-containing protein [Glycine max]XP_028199136.1 FCS-Like Zinc finger 6-like [Glycine soja]KAG4954709.1 hypothetical protein JHK87_040303 [Glycine soja]KAG5111072.1 hypothetical protein JHK82_040295 [Glycine max]KAH1094972.1 hypothetical protein GYH30_040319 [Glycine max]KAH1214010.1 Protein MARD1 [Glycine max]KRH16681.1 hypothetical protein GLYMA_14G170100v4 [Glycine max]|eukprot:NP_001238472.2 FCS-like zinc-finger domain-containing protein [Glycine max]